MKLPTLKGLAKLLGKAGKGLCKLLWILCKFVVRTVRLLCFLIVAILLAAKLATVESPGVLPGVPIPRPIVGNKQIHELIPHTRWSHLRPCGAYLDEVEEFNKARQCVNKRVPLFKKKPVSEDALPPRCYVITTDSPNVLQGKEFNAIPILDIFTGSVGGVLGFYDEASETLFIVENVDDPQVYRHELQHHFQHLIGETVNHQGDVWKQCEPPYYEPSQKSKMVHWMVDNPEL